MAGEATVAVAMYFCDDTSAIVTLLWPLDAKMDLTNDAHVYVTAVLPNVVPKAVTMVVTGDDPTKKCVLLCVCMIRSPVLHVVYWLLICR